MMAGVYLVFAQKLKTPVKCDYLLYVPKDYDQRTDSLPLIIYLHGASQRGKDLNMLKTYGLPHLTTKKGREYNFIIASPQCPSYTSWSGINWFEPLFAELKSKYRIDERRIYVTGMSMGGYGAWQAAMDYPDTFAAIMPLCGGCVDKNDICRISSVPVWAFHGTADNRVHVRETDRLVDRLQECEGDVRYSRLENTGHAIHRIYENPEIYEWLLSHVRAKNDQSK